jgi:hypothetical protein
VTKAKPENELDALLAPVKAMPPVQQLDFWRKFLAVHKRRVRNTEAQLCPEVLHVVEEHVAKLKAAIAQGV